MAPWTGLRAAGRPACPRAGRRPGTSRRPSPWPRASPRRASVAGSSSSWCSMSCTTAPVMMPTTSCIEWSLGSTTATRLPSRWMWMRSAISNTCGMLWLIRITGQAVVAHALDQLEHLAGLLDAERGGRLVHDHELARPRRRAGHGDALALAARERLHRLAHRADADLQVGHVLLRPPPSCRLCRASAGRCPSGPARRFSRPRNRFVAMSSAGATARSWYTVSMPAWRASSGDLKLTGSPSRQDLALVGDHGAGQRLDQARLAGAVVADHGEDLAGVEVEVGAVDGGHVAVALDQPAGLQDRRAAARVRRGAHVARLRASWSTDTARMTRMPVMRIW